jgi:serine protease
VEYYNPPRDHYFMTANPVEIGALDSGLFLGWVRTSQQLVVYLSNPAMPSASLLSPVCRYYGLPSAGLDSHFFSASPQECAAVAANWPTQWLLETPNAFHVFLPMPQYSYPRDPGACPIGTKPVYRLYNSRADINHRYTTSLMIRQQMIDAGWASEGYGNLGVAMCANNS